MNHEGLRQAAVLLASLHPRDRSWIQRRLPDGWRSRLKRLSGQVRALGPADLDVLRDAVRPAPETLPDPPPPDVLLAGLDGLSPAWVARTLAACAPDHRELYLAGRPAADQAAVEHALRDGPASLPPKLAATLARLVRERGERAERAQLEMAPEIRP